MTQKLHTVHVRINDAATGQPTACRVRFSDGEGTYYAPLGRMPYFETFEDVGGNVSLNGVCYAYIDGACEIRLPAGPIHIAVHKGPEYLPIHKRIELAAGQLTVRLAIQRWINLRERGWYASTSATGLTPHGAMLEGAAEDVAVVNLLADVRPRTHHDHKQIQSISPNLLAFSGQAPALERSGCLVVVNTENSHPKLGQVSLLNCHRPVYPLFFDTSDGYEDWTLADLCDQCHRKGGLATASGAMMEQKEILADIILGKLDALEPPFPDDPINEGWYDLLNIGLHVPLLTGVSKRHGHQQLANQRAYARLPDGDNFTYKNWVEAVRAGRTFVTTGPFLFLKANGHDPGAIVNIPSSEPSVNISVEARSLTPFETLEVVLNGAAVASAQPSGDPATASMQMTIQAPQGGWLLARCLGSLDYAGTNPTCAQTSPIYVHVNGKPKPPDRAAVNRLMAHLDRLPQFLGESLANLAVFSRARQELQSRLSS
jgi:hypothetical protein